jgi:lipoprotein-anchoring transpeptidase ErfK/SrfK
MASFAVSAGALPGKPRPGDHILHVRIRPKLVFYPGERKLDNHGDKVSGTIYVVVAGQVVKRYLARGGPKVAYKDGKHWARPTPAGTYTLGQRHHHVTNRWYLSTIAWGAEIRKDKSGIVQYKERGFWKPATGPKGKMRRAYLAEMEKPPTAEKLERKELEWFDVNGKYPIGEVVKTWKRNDFGKWAFGLFRQGSKSTDYYIHTAPNDEEDSEADPPQLISLSESHGCIHVKPGDRDEMWQAGYLAEGNTFVVKGYDEVGPP